MRDHETPGRLCRQCGTLLHSLDPKRWFCEGGQCRKEYRRSIYHRHKAAYEAANPGATISYNQAKLAELRSRGRGKWDNSPDGLARRRMMRKVRWEARETGKTRDQVMREWNIPFSKFARKSPQCTSTSPAGSTSTESD